MKIQILYNGRELLFDTVRDAALFLWGHDVRRVAVNVVRPVALSSANLDSIEAALLEALNTHEK